MSVGESHYDVLGIPTRAGPEQVEKAFRHAMAVYEEDSLATYSLLRPVRDAPRGTSSGG